MAGLRTSRSGLHVPSEGAGSDVLLIGGLGADTSVWGAHPERVRTLTLSGSWPSADRALRSLFSSWLWAAERAGGVGELLQTVYRWIYGPAAWNSGEVDEAIAQAAIAEVRA
jgi:hypothetical protein